MTHMPKDQKNWHIKRLTYPQALDTASKEALEELLSMADKLGLCSSPFANTPIQELSRVLSETNVAPLAKYLNTEARSYLEEICKLTNFARNIFYQMFTCCTKVEDMAHYLMHDYAPKTLSDELKATCTQLFLASDADGSVTGYLKLNWGECQTEPEPSDHAEIQRLYISPDWWGSGLSQALFDKALEAAQAQGARYLWLGVWEHNVRARSFYSKQGLAICGEHHFACGEDLQTDLVMKMEI